MSSRWWEKKKLEEMDQAEWESICDGCGKCCRIQLEDDEGQRATTNVVCKYMDMNQCSCTIYETRTELVPSCIELNPVNLHEIDWMPDTCSYRLLRDGKPLPNWHPLISGSDRSVHESGASVVNAVISEDKVKEEDLETFIIQWH